MSRKKSISLPRFGSAVAVGLAVAVQVGRRRVNGPPGQPSSATPSWSSSRPSPHVPNGSGWFGLTSVS